MDIKKMLVALVLLALVFSAAAFAGAESEANPGEALVEAALKVEEPGETDSILSTLDGGETYGLIYPSVLPTEWPLLDSTLIYGKPELDEQDSQRYGWGANLIVNGREGDFYEVTLAGKHGWILASEVRLNSDNVEYAPVNVLRMRRRGAIELYDFPLYKWSSVATVYQATEAYTDFEALALAGIVWKVRAPDGTIGYMPGSGENYTDPPIIYGSYSEAAAGGGVAIVCLSSGWVNVRSSPGGDRISIAYDGWQGKVLDEVTKGGTAWTHLVMNGQEGYIQSIYLQTLHYINADGVWE
ncbi:MAG: hypothetical protein LBK46_02280 [Oscillospiraceae bacterium]|jgi:hypothetical protein|nr:hypothetical protein [Oscillospiraceae bacterium]